MTKTTKVLVILLVVMIWPFTTAFAETNQANQEIDIATSPYKILLNLNNLKPGDYVTKNITVFNNGNQDFEYLFSSQFLDGSEKFYDHLFLKVESNEGILFDGTLKDFDKLEPRKLDSRTSEKLTIHIEFPYELGNEYQGLASEFQFKFYVEGTLGGILPVDNRLPNTATNLFNYLLIGATLILGGGSLYLYQRKKNLKTNKN